MSQKASIMRFVLISGYMSPKSKQIFNLNSTSRYALKGFPIRLRFSLIDACIGPFHPANAKDFMELTSEYALRYQKSCQLQNNERQLRRNRYSIFCERIMNRQQLGRRTHYLSVYMSCLYKRFFLTTHTFRWTFQYPLVF